MAVQSFRFYCVITVILAATLRQTKCMEKQKTVNNLRPNIPGEPNVDYPTLGSVPDTSFSCNNRDAGGYYAD